MVNHGEILFANKLRVSETGVAVRSVLGFWVHCKWDEIDELSLAPDRKILTLRLHDAKLPTFFKSAKVHAENLPVPMERLIEKCMVFPEFSDRYHAKKSA